MIGFNTPPKWLKGNLAAFVRVFVLAAFLVVAVQTPASAEQKSLEIFNSSGWTITEFYMTNTDYTGKNWGKNLLNEPLVNDKTATIYYNSDYNLYKFKMVVMVGRKPIIWTKRNFEVNNKTTRLTIDYDAKASFSIHSNN